MKSEAHKKRILFLVSNMEGGGAERVASLLCNYWVSEGYEVCLMPTSSGHGTCHYELDSRVGLDYLADHVTAHRKSIFGQIRRLAALRRAFKEFQPDVVVSFLTNVNVAAILASTGLKHRVIVSERGNPSRGNVGVFLSGFRKLAYRRADLVVAQTSAVAKWIQSNCRGAKTMVIANPVVFPITNSEPFRQPNAYLENGRRVILAVGRLKEEKGFEILVRAFARLHTEYKNWDVVIIGEGGHRSEIECTRDSLGLVGRVHLPGWAGNIGDWYQRADIYVMTSRSEGFPNTLIEAMSYGLPVISFDCLSGPADIIRNDQEGLLIPLSDESALESALKTLMSNEMQRTEMGNKAVEVIDRYSMRSISQLWAKAFLPD